MAQVPLTVPPEVKEKMRLALGLGEPVPVRFWKWIVQFFWIEPQVLVDHYLGTTFSEGDLRVISWQTRSPVMDIVMQRMPQTLTGCRPVLRGRCLDRAAHRHLQRPTGSIRYSIRLAHSCR